MYIGKLDDIVDIYNNTYLSTIKIKPVNVKSSNYIDFGIENNDKNAIFKVGDHVRISKYKMFLQRVTLQIGIKKFL